MAVNNVLGYETARSASTISSRTLSSHTWPLPWRMTPKRIIPPCCLVQTASHLARTNLLCLEVFFPLIFVAYAIELYIETGLILYISRFNVAY